MHIRKVSRNSAHHQLTQSDAVGEISREICHGGDIGGFEAGIEPVSTEVSMRLKGVEGQPSSPCSLSRQ